MPKITVVIPVGPEPHHKQWLDECIASVREQTHPTDEILLIDDMAGLPLMGNGVTVWHAPWRLGVAGAFNCGIGLATNDLVFMLGSDDWLEPTCLEECVARYEEHQEDAYYWVVVEYENQLEGTLREEYGDRLDAPLRVACNAAMVTKGLWKKTGGFPVEAVAAPDSLFLDVGVSNGVFRLIPVSERPLYHFRYRATCESVRQLPLRRTEFFKHLRTFCRENWKPPNWGGLKKENPSS